MMPEVNLTIAEQLGLLPEEYQRVIEILNRIPNFTELSIYSAMWSEHCSYKNSILQLKTLPHKGARVLPRAGENGVGMMAIDSELAVTFKIESYLGTATGARGIHRDIFSLGAQPIAALHSLRLGSLDLPRTRHLLTEIVKGIGDYGNTFGVPTLGGEIYVDPCYSINPLINAMSVGIGQRSSITDATTAGIGNSVFIVGPPTGKDDIPGAIFASKDISEDSQEKLPTAQPDDPFTAKRLLEVTLEALQTDCVVGAQSIGVAGINRAACEIAAKGKVGLNVWLDQVPTLQENMEPFEVLLSESQGRMLLVIEKGKEQPVLDIVKKGGLTCAQIGEVIEEEVLRYHADGEVAGEIQVQTLMPDGGAPVYVREQKEPAYRAAVRAFDPNQIPIPGHHEKIIHFLLSRPSIASKRWVTNQYNSMAGTTNTSVNSLSDAVVIPIQDRKQGLVVSTNGNSRYVHADPKAGCSLAVSLAARNIACSGGVPIGLTHYLNFGNPYNPEVYWQFAQAIRGMKLACEQFETPVTGGNVSLYNQSEGGPIFPTPTIGMVGIIEDVKNHMSLDFKSEGHTLYVLGNQVADFNCSEYLYSYHTIALSPAPYVNMLEEHQLQKCLHQLIATKNISSAHTISEGGLIVALLESAFVRGIGFAIQTDSVMRPDAFLYGEAGGRAIISVTPDQEALFLATAAEFGIETSKLGTTGGDRVSLDGKDIGAVSDYLYSYQNSLESAMIS